LSSIRAQLLWERLGGVPGGCGAVGSAQVTRAASPAPQRPEPPRWDAHKKHFWGKGEGNNILEKWLLFEG